MAFVMRKRGVHRGAGDVTCSTGARTEEVPESTTPRGLRCEEIKVSSYNGHSLSGVTRLQFTRGAELKHQPIGRSGDTVFQPSRSQFPLPPTEGTH